MSSRKLLVEHARSRISVSLCWIRGWVTILAGLAVMPIFVTQGSPGHQGFAGQRGGRCGACHRARIRATRWISPLPRPIPCPSNERHAAIEDDGLPGHVAVAYYHGDGLRRQGRASPDDATHRRANPEAIERWTCATISQRRIDGFRVFLFEARD